MMSESETAASGRRDFLRTVLAAPGLAAAMIDTALAAPAQRSELFVKHAYQEHAVNLGEVVMNYVVSGQATSPPLLLIPGQTESWWGFEKAIALLDKEFQVFGVDLRGRVFLEGTVAQSCPHERMLAQVKVPVLLTHHARAVNPATGQLSGALSDVQAAKVREIVTAAGQPFEYVSLPNAAHAMHQAEPARFAQVLTTWARTLPA